MKAVKAVVLLLGCVLLWSCPVQSADAFVVPPVKLGSAPYAEWAHHHWVWLNSDESNQVNVTKYVADYQAHNITVGAVDIDSAWSTGFNNFVVDTAKFPDMKQMVADFHAQGIRTILWATSMIDEDSTNFATAKAKDYFVKDGLDVWTPLKWWHGKGGLLDYSNPEAVEWWHSQLDLVLDLGIDGWKTDGTDPYIIEYVAPRGKGGSLTYRDYADSYYGDFFNYSRSKNGDDCLIMSRPVDAYPLVGEAGAYLNFSPRDVVFSGWVGDEDPTWDGMKQAATNMIYSAWYGYVGFGCDIGGYRTGPGVLGRTVDVFTRWFQLGAFLPLMENGGDKEHRPWKFDSPGSTTVVDTYRLFVNAHYELVPYLLTTGTQAYENGTSIMEPLQPRPKHLNIIALPDIKTYEYLLGPNFLVAPILEANVTSQAVTFPEGSGWADYFNASRHFAGGSTVTVPTPLTAFPVYVRHGSITPLRVSTPDLGHGDAFSADALTFMVQSPDMSGATVQQELREWKGDGMVVSYSASNATTLTVNVSAHPTESVIVLLRGVSACPVASSVAVNGQPLTAVPHPATSSTGWSVSGTDMYIRAGPASTGLTIFISNIK